jgi:hypothetical protein
MVTLEAIKTLQGLVCEFGKRPKHTPFAQILWIEKIKVKPVFIPEITSQS